MRKIGFALCIPEDIAPEGEIREPAERAVIDDEVRCQEVQLLGPEAETREGLEQPPGARHDSVSTAVRQAPREGLEDGPAVGGSGVEGGLQHGEFVLVGEEGGIHGSGGHPQNLSGPVEGPARTGASAS